MFKLRIASLGAALCILHSAFCISLAAPPATKKMAVWGEDGRPTSQPTFYPEMLRLARAAKLLNADLIYVVHPLALPTVYGELRERIWNETQVAVLVGCKLDACCAGNPADADTWNMVRSAALWLLAQQPDPNAECPLVLGTEACWYAVQDWWTGPAEPDWGVIRSHIRTLPAGITWYVYPGLHALNEVYTPAGMPDPNAIKALDQRALTMERRMQAWRGCWEVQPKVVFPGSPGRTWAEQRLIDYLTTETRRHGGCPFVYVSGSDPRCGYVDPAYAARLLAQAEKLPGRTLIYLCADAPPELLAGRVAAERGKLETGAQPTGN